MFSQRYGERKYAATGIHPYIAKKTAAMGIFSGGLIQALECVDVDAKFKTGKGNCFLLETAILKCVKIRKT